MHKEKDTKFKKGQIPWNKGLIGEKSHMFGKQNGKNATFSVARRQKISERMKGHTLNLGRVASEETKQKMSEAHRGEKSHLWRGGLTKITAQIRKSYTYRQWRSDVFTRDDFTCQECGLKGGQLHADHIKPFSVIVRENNITSIETAFKCEELWNINNGRTLCVACHENTDSFLNRWTIESMFKTSANPSVGGGMVGAPPTEALTGLVK